MRSTLLATDESDDRRDEHGFVVVWLAIVLVLLLSIAAFAVDLVHAYAQAQKLQNAVDAAALAGATQIPADLSGDAAKERVREIIRDNGFNPGELTLNEIDANNPNQMNVEMKHSFPTMFARVMGIATLTVRRLASGQYDAKVVMGSPANNLGDVPFDAVDSACADLNPMWGTDAPCASITANAKQSLFLQIQGRQTRKSAGNPYSSDFCHASLTDGCDGTPGSGGSNLQYSADGQYYYVHNDAPGAPLVIAVYDAGFVHVGGGGGRYCNGKPTKAAIAPNPKYPGGVFDPDWSDGVIAGTDPNRYYLNSPYCAGDTMQQGSGSCVGGPGQFACAQLFNTEFDVLASDATPNDPTDNPVLSPGSCGAGGAPWNVGGQAVAYEDPDSATPASPITATSTVSDGGAGTTTVPSRDFFQQYRVLCSLSSTDPMNSDYIVRVRAPNGSGSNNFSILALHDTGTPPSGNINIFTKQRLPLFAQRTSPGTGTFYVARIQPAARDRHLDIDLFDLGDTPPPASATGTIKITLESNTHIPSASPPDTFMQCEYSAPPGNSSYDQRTDPPWGPMTASDPGCTFRYDRSSWNGQWVTLRVTIPGYNGGNGYTCNTGPTATPRDCWIKMEITPDAGVLSDATSWNAKLGGAPVRLVK